MKMISGKNSSKKNEKKYIFVDNFFFKNAIEIFSFKNNKKYVNNE